MKILVPIKRVIDYNVKIHVKADETGVDLANVKMSLNPFDEIAVEEAVRLKEAGKTSEIIVVSIGSEKAQEQIRTAIAMGADRGILVQTDDPIDLGGIEPLAVAKILKILVEKENPDFVLMGKQSIDDDSKVFINEQVVSVEFLTQKLGAILENFDKKNVYLRADKKVSYGIVVNVI